MNSRTQRKCRTRRRLQVESLESRLCLASVGWDGTGQGFASLTYYIGDVPANFSLDEAAVKSAVQQALAAWSTVVNVSFRETSLPDRLDSIDIEFASIDGPGGVLAQAYLPDDVNPAQVAGDIRIDRSETWEVGNRLGQAAIDFLYVLVHELGHSLGLDHTYAAGAVMYPSVSPTSSFTALSPSDKNAALALYAPASAQAGGSQGGLAPADNTPASNTPASNTPASNTPADKTPQTPTRSLPTPTLRPNPWWQGRGGWFTWWPWLSRIGRRVASVEVNLPGSLPAGRVAHVLDAANANQSDTAAQVDASSAARNMRQVPRMLAFGHTDDC